jgi:hypothetical protein
MDFVFGAFMIILFFLIGIGLLWAGVRSWLDMRRIRPRLLKVQGVVTSIATESKAMRTSNDSRTYAVHRFPVIHFQTQAGEARSFRSEVGEVETRHRHRTWGLTPKRKNATEFQYVTGQAITVLYDPLDEVPPRIDTWSAFNGLSLALLAAGIVTCGVAILLGFLFGANIVNGLRGLMGF